MDNKEYMTKEDKTEYATKSITVFHPEGHQFVIPADGLKDLLRLNGFKTKKEAEAEGWIVRR